MFVLREGGEDGQTKTNRKILELAKRIKTEVIGTGICNDKPLESYDLNFSLKQQIIQQMYAVIIQELINQLKLGNAVRIELYALALVPQIAACNPSEFDWFMTNVVTNYDSSKFDAAITHLQNVYSCFGVTCADVGEYKGGVIAQCEDSLLLPNKNLVNKYDPIHDVREYLKLDRDVLRMHILCRREAWYQASMLYQEGYNGLQVGKNDGWVSLQDLSEEEFLYSNMPGESLVSKFVSYYNDERYKDQLLEEALYGTGWYSSVSSGTRAESTKRLLQAIFVPMYALEMFHKAKSTCSTNQNKAIEFWDRGASLLVGSIEGSEAGGSWNGTSWYSMSKEFCGLFGTCDSNSSDAEANANMMTLVAQGLEYLMDSNSCDIPASIIADIESALLIPLVQGTLHFAVVNAGSSHSDESLGAGYVFSRSILPVVKSGNQAWCEKIGSHINSTLGTFCDVVSEFSASTFSPTMTPTPGPSPSPTSDESENAPHFLAGRRGWISLTNVDKEANLALDRKSMIANGSDKDEVSLIYKNGLSNHSALTFETLSLQSSMDNFHDEFYTINVNAFTEIGYAYESLTYGFFDGKLATEYANTIVNDLLSILKNYPAIDAMLVMNTFMSITRHLSLALKACLDFRPGNSNDSGMEHLDRAMTVNVSSMDMLEESCPFARFSHDDHEFAAVLNEKANVSSFNFSKVDLGNELGQGCDLFPDNVIGSMDALRTLVEEYDVSDKLDQIDVMIAAVAGKQSGVSAQSLSKLWQISESWAQRYLVQPRMKEMKWLNMC